MITIDALCVRILDDDAEFTFEFRNAEELHSALQHWSGHPVQGRNVNDRIAASVSMASSGDAEAPP